MVVSSRGLFIVALSILILFYFAVFSSPNQSQARKFYESHKASKKLDLSSQLLSPSSFPLIPSPSKQCTHALILSTDDYFTCTAVALFSLLESNPEAKVVLFVAESVSKELSTALSASFPSVAVLDVELLLNPNPKQEVKGDRNLFNFTKWRIWQIDSETVIYMDSDFLVLKSLEGLCSSNAEISAIHNYETLAKRYGDYFNAGFLVIKPSRQKLIEMLNFSSTFFSEKGGDQDAINAFFKGDITDLEKVIAINANIWKDDHASWDIEKITSFHMTRDMNPCVLSFSYFEESMSRFLQGILPHDHPHFLWIRSFLELRRLHPNLNPFISSTFRR